MDALLAKLDKSDIIVEDACAEKNEIKLVVLDKGYTEDQLDAICRCILVYIAVSFYCYDIRECPQVTYRTVTRKEYDEVRNALFNEALTEGVHL